MKAILKTTILAAVLGLGVSMQAVPTLSLDDGLGHSVTVTDGSGADLNPVVGAVTWSGNLGNWFLNVATGVTKPVLGSANSPQLDLISVNAVNSVGGTMTIKFSEDGFTGAGLAKAAIGGTTDGTVTLNTFANATLLTSQTFAGNPFAGSTTGFVSEPTPYTLAAQAIVVQHGKGISSFDAILRVPDGGFTLGLLGFGLVAIEGLRRRIASR